MIYTQAVWSPFILTSQPLTVDLYVVVTSTGFVTMSNWDGTQFDRNDVAFWSPEPTPDA